MTRYASTAAFVALSFTASPEGRVVTQKRSDVTDRFRESVAIGHASLRLDLARIARDCSTHDWDGYNAMPVEPNAMRIANSLLDLVPPRGHGVDLSVGAEPDGHVTLEWHKSAAWTLSVSVSATGELYYAALLGSRTAYGTEHFDQTIGFPEAILDVVRRIEAA